MSVNYFDYKVEEETFLKALILSRGIEFSENALKYAADKNAKGQNLVYNMPLNATPSRPQEIMINNIRDGYSVVTSCVARNSNNNPVYLDVRGNRLVAFMNKEIIDNVQIDFVEEPQYYSMKLSNGENVKKYVSACGLDELNIIPWKGCAISQGCRFCGINNFVNSNELSAHKISKDKSLWLSNCDTYMNNLEEAIRIAVQSECYKEHAHVILIAGNLDNNSLDFESEIMASIAQRITRIVEGISEEGVVVVISPPHDKNLIAKLKQSGVKKIVFNLEAITSDGFSKYCPGKADLGYQFFVDRLNSAVEIFGRGNVWSNLVFGLENKEDVLKKCETFTRSGIVLSANVLHLDKGNTLDCGVPSTESVIDFFARLEDLNKKEGFLPFYCARALRTSLSNEAHDNRIKKI